MLRSGLALAGANRSLDRSRRSATGTAAGPNAVIRDPSPDDGHLTAAEATALQLAGTQLVVLSACETGLGDVRSGEGVYGLQRALIVAGARTTLLSLWKVDDSATQHFMARYYALLQQGLGRSDALAAVQREFRDGASPGQPLKPAWRDPYFWAAWQLNGDWTPIKGL
jgi:CHAT domain-containing protein